MARRPVVVRVSLAALAAGAIAAVWIAATIDTKPPLRFWIRAGDDPPRLFAEPEGRELVAVAAQRREEDIWSHRASYKCTVPFGFRELVRRALGLQVDPPRWYSAFPTQGGPVGPDGWIECVADFCPEPRLLGSGVVDPSLVGVWEQEGPFSSISHRVVDLRADGKAEIREKHGQPTRAEWRRVGDVLIHDGRFAGSVGVWVLGILDSTGNTTRGAGVIYRRKR